MAETAEDLVCASYQPEENLLAFAGAMSVGYLYSLSGAKACSKVTIALDSDEESQRPDGLVRLNGHYK